MTSVYPTEVSQYKLRTTGIAIFRFVECGFGSVCHQTVSRVADHVDDRLMASFAMSYAMANLGWKFYIVNASYDILFFIAAYLLFVETNGIPLEEIALKFDGPVVLTASVVEEDSSGEVSPVPGRKDIEK